MNMKFYMTPGSCSTGVHIMLEELDEIFEAHVVDLYRGRNRLAKYLAINPKGTVATLTRPDGTTLTDIISIAYWLAHARSGGRLWPQDLDDQVRAVETMTYVVATLHAQGFARIFAPNSFDPDSGAAARLDRQGRQIVEDGFKVLDRALGQRAYIAGDFSVADALMFYVEFWADHTEISLPDNILRHYRLMLTRPAARRVLMEEGYRPDAMNQKASVG